MGGSAKRRTTKPSGGLVFLPAKNQPLSSGPHSRSNAYTYTYPSGTSHPATSPSAYSITSSSEPTTFYNFEYAIDGATRGLGFPNDEEEEEDEDEGVMEEGGAGLGYLNEKEEEEEKENEEESENEGFISIGGVRVYTVDCSTPEDSSGSESESSDDTSDDSGSDIDDEILDDYLEGIGGADKLLNTKNVEDESSGDDENDDKLGGVDLMKVSKEYGMMKKNKKKTRFVNGSSRIVDVDLCSAMDDLMYHKDPRMVSGRKMKKSNKENIQLAKSWPGERRRSKVFFPGEKKKHRKELIAMKRRQRMINRGVDLEQINLKLKQMVLNKVDMLSFHPMHSRDCSQVQRLASIYHLSSSCQGSGKKRFVTVTRTTQTCLPSPHDKIRLDKLLGEGVGEVDFTINGNIKNTPRTQPRSRPKTNTKLSLHQSAPPKLTKSRDSSGKIKQAEKKKAPAYSERPVSFISSGIMEVDSQTETKVLDPNESIPIEKNLETSSSSKVGAFELHTKGFGSKMMAKMGFVEGSGLGKDGQGIIQPVEAVQRPKSLGLGIQFDEVVNNNEEKIESSEKLDKGLGSKMSKGIKTESSVKQDKACGSKMSKSKKIDYGNNVGAFEKHTKGFGSKMMARMGFVEGNGLGKDGQGTVSPLTAVRRPKCRGLGSK